MDEKAKHMMELGVAWCGPAFVVLYFYFWGYLGHNIPPPNMMAMSPEQLVTDHYLKFQDDIKVGMIMSALVGLLYLPWSCLLGTMLKDNDGKLGIFSFMELTGGALTGWVLAFCPAMWAACAFFADSIAAETVKVLHVLTWFIYDCTYMVTTVQLTGLGLYVILNRKQQLFPAWAGWAAFAVGIIFIPLTLMPFVTEGPFVVSGIWNFYIVFGTWLFGFFTPFSYYMLKALLGRKSVSGMAATAGG